MLTRDYRLIAYKSGSTSLLARPTRDSDASEHEPMSGDARGGSTLRTNMPERTVFADGRSNNRTIL